MLFFVILINQSNFLFQTNTPCQYLIPVMSVMWRRNFADRFIITDPNTHIIWIDNAEARLKALRDIEAGTFKTERKL